MSVELCSLSPIELQGLKVLVSTHPYNDYRHYRALPQELQRHILLSEIQRAAQHGHLLTQKEGEQIIGLATLNPLPWDSQIFGLPMARIGPLLMAPRREGRSKLIAELLDGVIEMARSQGIRHLSTRVDCADSEAIQSLEQKGFQLMECLVTYVFRPRQDKLPPIKTLYQVRPYTPDDRQALLSMAEQMYAQHQSRFSVDPDLPHEASARFYVEWVKNICTGEMADYILLAEKRGRPIGFVACKLNRHVPEDAGIRIAGQGLSAALPEATGAYIGLLKGIIEVGQEEFDFLEADAPLHHFVVLKTWQRLGFQLMRAKYALHRGLA
jgi:hypothetical protein